MFNTVIFTHIFSSPMQLDALFKIKRFWLFFRIHTQKVVRYLSCPYNINTYFQVIINHNGQLFQELPDKIIKKQGIQKIGNHHVEFKDGTTEYVDVIIYCTG